MKWILYDKRVGLYSSVLDAEKAINTVIKDVTSVFFRDSKLAQGLLLGDVRLGCTWAGEGRGTAGLFSARKGACGP